jgi:hypothetical protein
VKPVAAPLNVRPEVVARDLDELITDLYRCQRKWFRGFQVLESYSFSRLAKRGPRWKQKEMSSGEHDEKAESLDGIPSEFESISERDCSCCPDRSHWASGDPGSQQEGQASQ